MTTTRRGLEFSIPLPPKGCSVNRSHRQNWRVTHRAKQQYIADCLAQFEELRKEAPLKTPVTIEYTFYLGYLYKSAQGKKVRIPDGRFRPRDADNALGSMKCIQDELVRIGLIQGDSAHEVTHLPVIIVPHRDAANKRGVKVRIEEVAP